MDFKDLGNGRVIRQQTPRQAEPLQQHAVDVPNIAPGARAILVADFIVGNAGGAGGSGKVIIIYN